MLEVVENKGANLRLKSALMRFEKSEGAGRAVKSSLGSG
jgi:hypothetical protein